MSTPEIPEGEHTRRDAETLIALGLFMVTMSLPVMVGTIWAGHGYSQAVNFISGLVLFAVGAGMTGKGWRDLRRLK
jgi:hypothetical protein